MKLRICFLILYSFVHFSCTTGYGLKKYDIANADTGFVILKLNDNYPVVRSISGKFDFSYSTEFDRKQSSGYVYISAGDTLFLEINGIIGETEVRLFIDSDSLKAVNYFEKLKIRDSSDENSIRRLTGMDIATSDLINAFRVFQRENTPVKLSKRGDESLVLRSEISDTRYQFITLNEHLLITGIDEFSERELTFRKEYDYYVRENGYYFPKRIRIMTFNPPSKLTVFFNSIKVNDHKNPEFEVSL